MKTIPSNRSTKLPVVLTLCCIGALVLTTVVSSEAPKSLKTTTAKETVRTFNLGLGPHRFNFNLGRETNTHYLGSDVLQQAMQAGQFQPRTLVSNDFNGDGMGDLVIGYANNGAGALGVRQGNVQAIAPSDPSVFQGITEGRYPSPFLPEVKLYQLPEAPDFLQVGDFNSDGYSDVMAAARGGQRMYLLAGNERGNLGDPQSFEVPGLITEMQAATEQRGTFTQLALGLSAPGGAQLAVYDKTEDLDGSPEIHSMTGEVTGLAFDQLDGDGITDLAASTSNEVVVIHGRNAQPIASADSETKSTSTDAVKSVFIERQNVHFSIRGLATGNFAFDRNQQREIALLSDDGTVYLSALGTPDTRPFTKAEKEAISKLRRSFALNKIDMETLTAEINKFVRPNRGAGWNVAETMRGTSAYTGTGKALFQRSNASRRGIDELLIGNGINHTVEVIRSERETAKLKMEDRQQASDPEAVSVAGAPIAAVSMRMTVGGKEGMVLLAGDNLEPTVNLVAPDRTFTVNSTADLPDSVPTAANGVCQASNGLCTLRAAVMQSNHSGGANAIMVPNNTYTLTLGPPDDEANTGGALEQSGDLDIFSWDAFTGEPILTQVTITGGTRDGCIIQMGTLSPTLAANSPTNKERILQVNDGAVGAGAQKIDVALTNLTMQNGVSPTGSGTFLDGGAVRFDGFDFSSNTNVGLLILNNVKLTNNTSAGAGGGVFAGFGSLTIENSSIVRANSALNKVGGGVAWTGGNTVETQGLTITSSTIGGALVADGNLATHNTFGAGAGVDARGGAFITVQTNSVIRNNVASVDRGSVGGGGIQINSPIVAISLSEISDNKSKHNGGGIYSSARNAVTNAPSTITLTDVDVLRNQADSDNLEDPGPGTGFGDGGGIFNYFGSMTIQTNSHIDGNSAYDGGGIFSTWTFIPADFTASLSVLSGSTIGQVGAGLGNSARNNGGSLNINPTGAPNLGTINLNSLTFANSTANSDNAGGGDGGAIFIGAGAINSLNSCTFDGNIVNGSGTGDAIRQSGGTITGAGTLNFNNGESISLSGGTFTSTSGTLNLTGNLLNSGGNFAHNNGTVVFNGSAAQSIGGTTAITFNNLIINNSNGVSTNTASTASTGTLTLTNGALAPNAATTFTVNGPVSFTSGTFNANATSTVNYNKASNTQSIAPGNYGNLTFSNFTKQLPASIKIAGTFTTGAAGGHTVTGSTVEFNGTGAQTLPANFTTYNNLTLNNTAGVTGFAGLIVQSLLRVQAGTFTSSSTYNDVQIDLNATLAGVNATTINVTGNWTNNGTFTPNGNTVNFNGGAGQVLSGTPTSQIFNNFTMTKAGGVLSTSGGTTSLDINGNLTLTTGSFTAPGAINLAGNFSQATGTTFTPGSGTVTFDGGAAQNISGTLATKAFFNFAVNKGGGSTLSAAASTTALDINGDVTLTAGIFSAATATGITVAGNWTNTAGTTAFNGGTGTVTLDGASGQSIGGTAATTFNALTLSSAGTGAVLGQNATVNGTLTLNNNLTTAANVLIQPSTAPASVAGLFDVIGSVRRTGSPLPSAVGLTFGNQNNIINFTAAGTRPSEVTITLVKTAPATFTSAVQRTYSISQTGGTGFSATLRLRYLESELNGNVESQLDLWRFDGATFVDEQQTARDSVNNWVEKSGVTAFSDWTFATHVNQAPSVTPNPAATLVNTQTSAIVLDRQAVDAAFVTHFKITGITNGALFQNNGTTPILDNEFITYAEGTAGVKFTPALNSLSQGSFNVQASSSVTGTGLSPSTTAVVNVSKGTTSVTITGDSPDSSSEGQVVQINYSVAVLTGAGTPSGDVVITVNDASGDTCTGTVAAGTCNLTLTTAGLKQLTATYAGDTLFFGNTDTEDHEVLGPPVATDDNYSTFKNTQLNIAAPGVLTNDTGSPTVSSVGLCVDVTAPFENCATTAGGVVTVNADGSFSYTPLAGYVGADSFNYTATNGGGNDTATVNITVSDSLFINEILFDPPSTDAPHEYLEFRGVPSGTIPAGTYLVAIEGDGADNAGDIQTIINLSGLAFGTNGFLVLLQNSEPYSTALGANVITSTTTGFGGLPGAIWSADGAATDIEDASVTFMVIQTGTVPALTDDIDTDDNGTPDGATFTGWTVLDSIGVLDGTATTDRAYGAINYSNNTGTPGTAPGAPVLVAFTASYVGRSGDTTGSTAADWVASGALGGVTPNWTLSATETEPVAFANQPLNHIGTTNFDISPPAVQSINRVTATPTNLGSVDFLVTFSESVTGVDTTDFALTTGGGIAAASVTGVTGSGATRTVSVNTGTGDGTIRLDLVDDDTILDGSNNKLGGVGVGNGSFTAGQVYTIDKSVPTVDITDIAPDPRATSVGTITIVFSEAISGFDLADLSLTRNGGGNLLTGAQTLSSGDNITWTLDNLASITTSDGTYVLTLTAAGSSITDGLNALVTGASDTWVTDGNAPTVDITDVTPDPRNTSVSSISIVFSEAVTGFDLADLTLTRDGGANLLTGGQTLTTGDNINFSLTNLSGLTGTAGTYLLTLTAPGGITDGGGNALASGATDSWVVDTSAPTVDIIDVTPDPRNTSVSTISIVFSEAVTGFDIADLSLNATIGGITGGNSLSGSQTLTTSDNITWTLNNLTSLTVNDANYSLTLTSGGITDNAGNALAAGATETWLMNAAAPTVDIVDVAPDPRGLPVDTITINFSESVTGFDLADLSLTRDGGANLLTGAQTLITGVGVNWTLTNLSGITAASGTYTLTLTAPGGIIDRVGEPLASGDIDSWVMDATGPSVTINQASGQADPTSTSPINFTVVFNEPVTNFISSDVSLSGTAGATTAVVTQIAPNNGTTYNVAVSGMTSSGTVVASLAAGVAQDALGNVSQASTSTDNTVQFDLILNVAPVLDNTGNMTLSAINEDVANASNPGTLVSGIIASAGGDRITDADAGALEGIAVTAANNANGTWQYSINNGTNWTAFGSPDATTARLLAADANTRVRFIPNANFNGTVAPGITFRAWDQFTGANGGTADVSVNGGNTAFSSATETADITVNAVNDAPTANAQAVVTNEGAPVGITLSGSDVETAAGSLSFTVTVQPTNGVLSGTAPNLTYTPNADFNGADSFKFRVTDTGDGPSPALTSTEATVSITVNAVNDGPVNTVPGAQSTSTNTARTFSAGNGNLISIADIDAGTNPLQVTLTATNGTFSLSGTSGLVFSVGDGTADATMTFTGTITNINNALNGLVFTPTGGFNGAASLQIITNDQGNTGSGGAQSDTDTVNITVSAGGTIQFSAATYAVAENAGPAAITITRTGGASGTATVLFQTSNGTAGAGDYTTVSQTVTFVDGDTSETVNIPITNDLFNEPSKTVNLTLSNAGGSGQLGTPINAVLTINDDDAAGGIVRFTGAIFTVGESSGPATITVERVGTTTSAFTVDYQTSDHSNPPDFVDCTAPGPGLASSRCDFVTAIGTLKFAAGQTSATFTVLINQDNDVEGTETLSLTLSNPSGAAVLGPPSTATLQITDDPTEPAGNPIDTSSEFVKQHYRDFLNREPDAPGLAFWTDNIEKCNDPARRPAGQTVAFCIDKQRESTAIAFFVAPEFQMTGGFVYLLYKGSLPGAPDYDNSSPPGGRFPTYLEFMRDVRQVAEGIVVSDQISGAKVEANREQLAQDFVQRPEFVTLYGGLNNTQYVNALFNVTRITPSQADKDALVTELNNAPNATQGRASVLRKIVDGTQVIAENNVQFTTTYGQAFHQQEFTRTFVFMEYIGYLRRNPDDAGFVHWLGKLNFFGGNPFQAEMVRAFIISPEYRSRFGQP